MTRDIVLYVLIFVAPVVATGVGVLLLELKIISLWHKVNFLLDVIYGFRGNGAKIALDEPKINLNGIAYERNGDGEWRRVDREA